MKEDPLFLQQFNEWIRPLMITGIWRTADQLNYIIPPKWKANLTASIPTILMKMHYFFPELIERNNIYKIHWDKKDGGNYVRGKWAYRIAKKEVKAIELQLGKPDYIQMELKLFSDSFSIVQEIE